MKILALGDVTGTEAVAYLEKNLRKFKRENEIDFTVINAENSAQYNGVDKDAAERLFDAGADVLTTGNHVYRIGAVYSYLDDCENIIRPANLPGECPGSGYVIFDTGTHRILVMNLLGVTYMEPCASPFDTADAILKRTEGSYDIAIIDMHAEATSEKAALARYLDGRVTAVFGTHTHIQTNDPRILPKGTGFITDIGMCGPDDSILGVMSDRVIDKLRLHMPRRFEYASGKITAHGVIFTLDDKSVVNAETVSF